MSEIGNPRFITAAEAEQRFGGGGSNSASLILNSTADSSNPTDHPYTYLTCGLIVKNASAGEIFRIWASDPDVVNNFNSGNLYVGFNAGLNQPTDNASAGYENTGIGYESLRDISTGHLNVGIGSGALSANAAGNGNVAIGHQALFNAVNEDYNTAVGLFALYALAANGSENVAVGYNCLPGLTFGSKNTTIGHAALSLFTTGSRNTAVGSHAGLSPIVGDDLVLIGSETDTPNGTSNVIVIGSGATAVASNTAVIGNTEHTDVFLGSVSGLAKLHCKGDAIVFPDSDPHVAGAAYWVSGVLTKSAG